MIVSTLIDSSLDMPTVIRAYKERATTLLVFNPDDHEPIDIRVEKYDYFAEAFVVTHRDMRTNHTQALRLAPQGTDWQLTPS